MKLAPTQHPFNARFAQNYFKAKSLYASIIVCRIRKRSSFVDTTIVQRSSRQIIYWRFIGKINIWAWKSFSVNTARWDTLKREYILNLFYGEMHSMVLNWGNFAIVMKKNELRGLSKEYSVWLLNFQKNRS